MSNINAVPDPNLGILRQYSDGTANLTFQTNGANAVVINESQIANFVSTGAVTIPRGTTAQRPSSAVNGMFRANSNFGSFEVYLNGSWDNVTAVLTPINSVAPVVSGSTTVGGNATVTTGTWNNSPTSFAYQWRANAVAISNATANVFTITSTQTGANLSCNVTAINASGSNIPTTSNSVGPVTATYTATYLVIAGGGAIYDTFGGGGGAGGYLESSATFTPGTVYSATVGAGGAGTDGSNSILSGTGLTTVTAIGGGKGGTGGTPVGAGSSGGSGGGAGGFSSSTTASGGSGTSGQGNAGGTNATPNPYGAGGGGGAGAVGGNASSNGNNGGNGGNGLASSITGTSVTRAGGGGGGCNSGLGTGGSGGAGGGGTGSGSQNGGTGTNGTANTGGGGGANPPTGGGSGVVILSVPTASYSGVTTGSPTVTTSGSNTIMTFNSSGTYTA